jgi:hypothetical protein
MKNYILKPSRSFNRKAQISRLIGADPQDLSLRAIWGNIKLLKRAARGEAMRGQSRHWAYDINRHIALLQAIAEEKRFFRRRIKDSPDYQVCVLTDAARYRLNLMRGWGQRNELLSAHEQAIASSRAEREFKRREHMSCCTACNN